MLKELGKYKIIKQLSTGSAANIYLAVQKNLERQVVIKQLMREFSLHKKLVARFEQEAKVISSLRYDSIIHIYDYWKKGNSYYIVMEYVSGKTLKEILHQTSFFPKTEGLIIFYEILKALEYAHNQGVVHRDLKPANIMISEEGRLKILDFGIAHVVEKNMTNMGVVIGTYSYMSPEQAIGNKIDHRSDIFSLGIVMYELLCGKKPFKKDEQGEVTDKIINQKPISVRKINPQIPWGVGRIIKKCLRKKPNKRFQDTGQIKKKLEKYIRKLPVDHQSVLKKFVEDSTPLPDQKTVLMEKIEKKEKKEKRKKKKKSKIKEKIAKLKDFLKITKTPRFRIFIITMLLFIILIEIEVLFNFFNITLSVQKEWLISSGKLIFLMTKKMGHKVGEWR
jgi:serine/threonine-protein kinase